MAMASDMLFNPRREPSIAARNVEVKCFCRQLLSNVRAATPRVVAAKGVDHATLCDAAQRSLAIGA